MTRTQIFEHVNEKYSVTPDYPWEADTSAVLRHPQNNKWFALIMNVKNAVLGLHNPDEYTEIMNVKLNPILIEDLSHEEGFLPAYHMNKKYWTSVIIDKGLLTDEAIKDVLEKSWEQIKPKGKNREKSNPIVSEFSAGVAGGVCFRNEP